MSLQATILPKGYRGDMANGFNPKDAANLALDPSTEFFQQLHSLRNLWATRPRSLHSAAIA